MVSIINSKNRFITNHSEDLKKEKTVIMARKILVTGGAGMIGSNLVKALKKRGDSVIVVDNLWRGKLEYLYEDGQPVIDLDKEFFNINLTEPDKIDFLLEQVEYVVHLADIVAGINYVFSHQ